MASAGLLLLLALDGADEPPAIQDNSFLVEEAYNQDEGVVQHISTFSRSWRSRDWTYTFTQEWPLSGVRHQISFSVPLESLHDGASTNSGLGDVTLNYRYQLAGSGETRLAVAPRLTAVLPTGDTKSAEGALGLQCSVPVSVVVSKRVVTHLNVGLGYTPSAEDASREHAATTAYEAALSVVWLASRRVNFLLESYWERAQSVTGPDRTTSDSVLLLSPGVRWSHNSGGLQIVPGFAFPIDLRGQGAGGLLLYLSFEHPFRARSKAD